MANAGRSTRDLNLSHPASYTALTRTMLVPAKERGHNFALLIPQRHVGGLKCCVMLCSFTKWQRFPSNWKPAANTGVLFRQELVIPLRHDRGSHAAIFLTNFHFQNLIKILFDRLSSLSFLPLFLTVFPFLFENPLKILSSKPYKVFLSHTLFFPSTTRLNDTTRQFAGLQNVFPEHVTH